jgi:hypothetical protein
MGGSYNTKKNHSLLDNMTVYFFANEELNCNRPASKEDIHKPVTVIFKGGPWSKIHANHQRN